MHYSINYTILVWRPPALQDSHSHYESGVSYVKLYFVIIHTHYVEFRGKLGDII